MDSYIVLVVAHFNGSVTITYESMIFMCDYPALVYLLDTMLLEELRVELSQSINVGFQKRVEKIRYKCERESKILSSYNK